ncbi:hypothetical protein KAR91_01510 [Candidatus Pacearchaeota archaeon]|nr:hypothetical protein [Candidatus Pacearchaeota archaeon]
MSSPFRTTNPAQFDEVDGIIINESAPPPSIRGVATGIALLIAQFQRGAENLIREVGSIGEVHENYGKSSFEGNIALKNKGFGRLRLLRVIASDAVKATFNLDDGVSTDLLQLDALYKGVYGNSLKVTVVVNADDALARDYKIEDTSTDFVLPAENYKGIKILGIADQAAVDAIFGQSKLVKVTFLANSAEVAALAQTPLATGSDGTVADTDYETAIDAASAEGVANILFLEKYSAVISAKLKTHVAATQDRIAIIAGETPSTQDKAGAITDADSYRDTDGRLIYAFNGVKTNINGIETVTSPASWVASTISQTSPHIDPAFADNSRFMAGATGLVNEALSRADFIQLKDAGIAGFEFDPDLGFKLRSGITTQILNSSKVTILRRRMADFLTTSAGQFLKNFQNAPNTRDNRRDVGGSILSFVRTLERDKILPSDDEVQTGAAKIVDVESLNTDASIAAGRFTILWKQRIFSSMRYIILQAEIGESVVVTEG